jgi:hypothetical protein
VIVRKGDTRGRARRRRARDRGDGSRLDVPELDPAARSVFEVEAPLQLAPPRSVIAALVPIV